MEKKAEAMTFNIAMADADDLPDILSLQKRAYETEARIYGDWSLPALTQSLESLVEECKTSRVLKAVVDGRIVGSVRARCVDDVCHIGRLVVEQSHRGRGIGKALLARVEHDHATADRFQLFTGSKSVANIAMYEGCGYKKIRVERLSPSVELVFLEKIR